MRTLICFVVFAFSGCAANVGPTGPTEGPKNTEHVITQLGDNDGGVEDAGAGGDIRIAVAYCAAAVLDSTPAQCSVEPSDEGSQGLATICNTGLSIVWNCEKCGDVEKDGKAIGHVLMTSDTRFEVKSTSSNRLMVCEWNPDTHSFVTHLAN